MNRLWTPLLLTLWLTVVGYGFHLLALYETAAGPVLTLTESRRGQAL